MPPPWRPRPPRFAPAPGGIWGPQPAAQGPVPYSSGGLKDAVEPPGPRRRLLLTLAAVLALAVAAGLLGFLLGAFDGPDRPNPPKPSPSTSAPAVPGPTAPVFTPLP
ncbi:hypothetical protein ACPC54_39975 [Kitasatospora sp. NPDC094028]